MLTADLGHRRMDVQPVGPYRVGCAAMPVGLMGAVSFNQSYFEALSAADVNFDRGHTDMIITKHLKSGGNNILPLSAE